MQTRELGRTGLEVSCVGLGAMPLSLARRPDEEVSVGVVQAALDAGMTLIDTADVYCLDHTDYGHNERLIRKALAGWAGDADGVIVATKGGLERPRGAWTTNGRPKHLKAACDASLKALGVESIDLYQLHAPDDDVPFADSVGALAELQEAGKIRHIGLSNVGVRHIEEARKQVEVVSVQNRCNPFDRRSFDNGVVAHCDDNGITFLPHSPVGGHQGHNRTSRDPTLKAVAERHGATPYEVCIAWLLAVSPAAIPIPGASRVASAVSSARAGSITLTSEDLAELAEEFPT